MLPQNTVAVVEVEPRALAEWAAAQPEIVPAGWGCSDAEAALALIGRNPAFARRLAGMYICAHTPAAKPVHRASRATRSA